MEELTLFYSFLPFMVDINESLYIRRQSIIAVGGVCNVLLILGLFFSGETWQINKLFGIIYICLCSYRCPFAVILQVEKSLKEYATSRKAT